MADARISGLVLIAGPDGAGKSTVVDAIAARAAAAGITVSRAHHRPGLIAGRRQDGPVTDPHAKPARPTAAALAKLAVVFADYVVGGHVRWRAPRRDGLLLLERGWFDMVVDPRRYRLPERLLPLVRLLGRLVPRPDVVLLLSGDPERLHERKPEIGVAEVTRQIDRWRTVAPVAGRRVVAVDTVTIEPETASTALFDSFAGRPWYRVPFTPSRVELRTTGDARAGLAVYQPQSRRARAGAAVARRGLHLPVGRVDAPLPLLDDLWRLLELLPSGVAAMRSSTPGRHVLSVCDAGQMCCVVKIGENDDSRLRHEAAMLSASLHPELPLQRPELIWAGEWQDCFVMATRAARRSSTASWSVDDVVPVARALAQAGQDGAPLTHGDLAPWNLVRTADGPMLLDWESARWVDEPLHDLAHFVFQGGALLGRYGPEGAVSLLCDARSPGCGCSQRGGWTPTPPGRC